eukprot:gene13691-19582_t
MQRSMDDVSGRLGSSTHNMARRGPAENLSSHPKRNSFRQRPSPPMDSTIFTTQSDGWPSSPNSTSEVHFNSVSEVPVPISDRCAFERSPHYQSICKALFLSLEITSGITLPAHPPKEARDGSLVTSPYLLLRGSREHSMLKMRGSIQSPKVGKMSPFEEVLAGARDFRNGGPLSSSFRSRGSRSSSPVVTGCTTACSSVVTGFTTACSHSREKPALGGFFHPHSSSKSVSVHPGLQAPVQTSGPSPDFRTKPRFQVLAQTSGPCPMSKTMPRAVHARHSGVSGVFGVSGVPGVHDAAGCSPASTVPKERSMIPVKEHVDKAGGGLVERAHAGTISSAPQSVLRGKTVEPCKGISSDPMEEGLVEPCKGIPSDPMEEGLVEPCKGIPSDPMEEGLLEVGERKVEGQPHKEKKNLSLMAKINRKLKNIMPKGSCAIVWPRGHHDYGSGTTTTTTMMIGGLTVFRVKKQCTAGFLGPVKMIDFKESPTTLCP